MSKKVKRGFMGYLFIFLGLVLACFAVCIVVMIFKPGLKVFGISYFSETKELQIESAEVYRNNEAVVNEEGKVQTVDLFTNDGGTITTLQYETLEINSNVYDVEFYSHPETDSPGYESVTNILIKSDTKGFVKEGLRKLQYSAKYFEDTKVLQINVEAPIGFVHFANASKIRVEFPKLEESEAPKFKIVANTQSGNITLGGTGTGATMLKAQSVNLTTTSGKISTTEHFNLAGVFDNSIKTDSGDVSFLRPIICNNFNLTTKTGEMNFENSKFEVAGEFNYTAENAFLHLNNLTASKINFASTSGKIYAKTLSGPVDFKTETENCHLQVDTINGSLIVGTLNEDSLSTRTKVDIANYVAGPCNIFTLGEINIGEIKSATIIRNQDANVTIKKVSGTLILDSKSGKITLGKIADENGNFLTAGVESRIVINCSENADVELYFRSVVDGSLVKTEKGDIYADLTNVSTGYIATATAQNITHNGEAKDNPYVLNNGSNNLILTAKEKLDIKTA